jgi:hypothetical protein
MPTPATARLLPIVPLDDEREPTTAELLAVSHEHTQDLLAANLRLEHRVAELEADKKSLTSRTRTMEAVLIAIRPRTEEFPIAPVAVGVYGQGSTVDRIVIAAQTCEALGDVAMIRYVRNAANAIVGAEVASLPSVIEDGDECDPGFRLLSRIAVRGGRSVVG